MPSLILCAEILDYLGDATTAKLVFVVFRAFVGFVHDIALSASVMADEKAVLFLILLSQRPSSWQLIKLITAELGLLAIRIEEMVLGRGGGCVLWRMLRA